MPEATNGNGQGGVVNPALTQLHEPRFAEVQSILRTLDVLLDRQAFMKQAGLQFDGRRDLYDIFGYDRIITGRQFRDEYARGGLAKTIVDAYPEATWRGGVEVYEDEDPKVSTPFERAFGDLDKRHQVFFKLQAADTLAQLSTYAVILIGAPGFLDQELPRGNPGSLLYLQPFWGGGGPGDQSRGTNMGTQSVDTDVTIETFDVDPASERFGDPLTYRIRRTDISSPLLARSVHWTRIIHVPARGALDSNVYGPPALECVWNLLFDLEKVTGGGAESFFQRAKHVLHANIDKDVAFTDPQLADLKKKLDEYQHNMTTMIPTRGVDLKLLESASSKTGGPEADSILTQIAGATKIPKRILTGSEMGELASTQDAANFDSRVKDRRTGYAEPVLARALVDRLIRFGYLPEPRQYEVGWSVEESMDEKGKAAFALDLANVNKTFDGVVFTDDEIRDMAFDKEPLPDVDAYEQLSESQRADIASKLALTNKAMGITVFTDDEIREITYGFSPLSDDEKVPIGAPERISVTQPPELGEDGQPKPQPVTPGSLPAKPAIAARPALRAAEDRQLLRVLELAIRRGDRATVDKILGLQQHKFGTVQAQLPSSVAARLVAYGQGIPDEDLAVEAGGRESDAHVTVKYGLLAPDAELLRDVPLATTSSGQNVTTLGKAQVLALTLGRTSTFAGPDYDVVVVDVQSEDLVAANRGIGAHLDCAPSSHPVYLPHATVAYVKAGLGQRYVGWAGLDGVVVTVDRLTLSDADGRRTEVPLG